MAKAHPVEEKMPKGRKPRSSQRQEGRGQVRRGCNLEVRPERREREQAQGQLTPARRQA